MASDERIYNEGIPQLDPVIVRPGDQPEESLLSRLLGQFDKKTVEKIKNRVLKRVKRDVTKEAIGGIKSIASSGKPLEAIGKKATDVVEEFGSKEYIQEVGAEVGMMTIESNLNKMFKKRFPGLKLDLETDIKDDYWDLAQGKVEYTPKKGGPTFYGGAQMDEGGLSGFKGGVKFKYEYDTPLSQVIIKAFNNMFKQESDNDK